MSNRHESFTAEYCTGETVTLYSQQHHTRIHLQPHSHVNNHIPLNQSKIIYYSFKIHYKINIYKLYEIDYKLHTKDTAVLYIVLYIDIQYSIKRS